MVMSVEILDGAAGQWPGVDISAFLAIRNGGKTRVDVPVLHFFFIPVEDLMVRCCSKIDSVLLRET